jgi:hypothetical protein
MVRILIADERGLIEVAAKNLACQWNKIAFVILTTEEGGALRCAVCQLLSGSTP